MYDTIREMPMANAVRPFRIERYVFMKVMGIYWSGKFNLIKEINVQKADIPYTPVITPSILE